MIATCFAEFVHSMNSNLQVVIVMASSTDQTHEQPRKQDSDATTTNQLFSHFRIESE